MIELVKLDYFDNRYAMSNPHDSRLQRQIIDIMKEDLNKAGVQSIIGPGNDMYWDEDPNPARKLMTIASYEYARENNIPVVMICGSYQLGAMLANENRLEKGGMDNLEPLLPLKNVVENYTKHKKAREGIDRDNRLKGSHRVYLRSGNRFFEHMRLTENEKSKVFYEDSTDKKHNGIFNNLKESGFPVEIINGKNAIKALEITVPSDHILCVNPKLTRELDKNGWQTIGVSKDGIPEISLIGEHGIGFQGHPEDSFSLIRSMIRFTIGEAREKQRKDKLQGVYKDIKRKHVELINNLSFEDMGIQL